MRPLISGSEFLMCVIKIVLSRLAKYAVPICQNEQQGANAEHHHHHHHGINSQLLLEDST